MATKAKEKKEARRARARQNQRGIPPWLWGVGVGVIALLAVLIIRPFVVSSNLPGESFPSQGNVHIQLGADHPEYNSNPPTSGWHTNELAAWGSYDYTVPDERLIHNLEDGGVILWYPLGTPEENAAHIERLEDVSQGYRHIVIAPREDLDSAYVLTAWQRLQRFDEFDAEGMGAFIEAFEGIDHHR